MCRCHLLDESGVWFTIFKFELHKSTHLPLSTSTTLTRSLLSSAAVTTFKYGWIDWPLPVNFTSSITSSGRQCAQATHRSACVSFAVTLRGTKEKKQKIRESEQIVKLLMGNANNSNIASLEIIAWLLFYVHMCLLHVQVTNRSVTFLFTYPLYIVRQIGDDGFGKQTATKRKYPYSLPCYSNGNIITRFINSMVSEAIFLGWCFHLHFLPDSTMSTFPHFFLFCLSKHTVNDSV